ncbi:septum formation family protein [Mycolicibacterium holsaticum]|uniref:Septum formation family protein n=1 Tax=Mycolicibacterium holsaticum TaxID=152142 RepID=A0A1E3RZS6_9MYCO|nr:septum formation family protein [Mycolicibacterium holsaticum]MDA4109979.1 septum formation family protein [Mycolicibacterium holsaticum DSM 44478 = JCM 12374]ODQ95344.1 septum formation family protein [Mycolicibacterium holsaticum]QZA12100.1 septum formation family protein [Mycolicibacterium holsaticum DSM 44478 = JCM 12374]UNC10414.1 septum formation family protein [Mycolicibacterium holsaticum DSM 44478 = JCM 12374]
MTTPPGQPPPYGPPPSPYGGQPYPPPPGQPYPPPPPPPYSQPPGGYQPQQKPNSKSNKVLLIVLGVIVGLIVLVVGGSIALFLIVGKDTVTATDVKVGDCLKEIPDGARVLTVQTTGCDEPHAGEVFAVLLMPDGDFPGQNAIDDYADKCSPELASYSPAAMEDDSIQMYVLYPTAETWAAGDRAVTCIATLDPPRAGTIKG